MINELFTYTDADHSLTAAEEVAAIEAAQAGDSAAYESLLRAYGPTLRASVNRAKKTIEQDEAQAVALLTFHEVLTSFEPDFGGGKFDRLATRLTGQLAIALQDAQASEAAMFEIPGRTFRRYLGIVDAADGDLVAARELAPKMSMSVDTFDTITRAAASESLTGADDEESPENSARPLVADSPITDAEDAILVDVAFSAVDDDEERICRLSYGFTEYDPQPDAEIAHRMGLTRPTVQRKRAKALGKMRKALGVTLAS